jgi:hypothetical protein
MGCCQLYRRGIVVGSWGAAINRYERSDRQRGDKPDVRFGANADHDKTSRRADLENADNFEPVLDDRIIDVGPPLV